MARSEARLKTRIWDDADFLALESYQQLVYLFLISQADINHCGVVSLRLKRWSKKLRYTPQHLDGALAGLAKAGFVVVDEDEEELLVRSFVRNDGVCRQPKVLLAAARQLAEVSSHRIREALAAELQRILSTGSAGANTRPTLLSMLSALGRVADTQADTHPEGYAEGYREPNAIPDAMGTGVGVGVGENLKVRTTTSSPPSGGHPEGQSKTPTKATCIPDDFTLTDDMIAWGRQRCPDVNGARETEKFINYWVAKSGRDATKKDWVRTWRNWMLTAQERLEAYAARRGDPADRHLAPADERCPDHPREPRGACGICASERHGGLHNAAA